MWPYFFRIFDKGLFTHAQENGAADTPHAGDAPLSMLVPAFALALAILLVGIYNQVIVNQVIRFAIPTGL